MNNLIPANRVLLNYTQDFTRDDPVGEIFPNGVPDNEAAIKSGIESHYDLPAGSLHGYTVTQRDGNFLVRKQATFGGIQFGKFYISLPALFIVGMLGYGIVLALAPAFIKRCP